LHPRGALICIDGGKAQDTQPIKQRKETGMKKGLFWLVVLTLMITLAAGTSVWAVQKSDGKVILKLAHVNPVGSPTDKAAKRWASLVSERSNGTVEIKIFPNEQLGIEKAALEGVVLGTIDCSLNDAAYHADLYPCMGVFDFPYTYRDWDHYRTVLRSPILGDLDKIVEKEVGLKVLAPFIFGRRMLCSNRPVFEPKDAEGLKIRTPPSELAMENARVLGGVPTTIAYSEAYMGLKQGVADAAENPFTGIYDMKWYEVTKYLVVTEHVWNNEILSISKRAWSALSEEQQEIMKEAALEAAEYRMKLQQDLENQRMWDLKRLGMHVILPSSTDPFRKIADEIEAKYRDKYATVDWGSWHDQVLGEGK
jgi:tripartite ATP-independent transporter DctP family solute receptor